MFRSRIASFCIGGLVSFGFSQIVNRDLVVDGIFTNEIPDYAWYLIGAVFYLSLFVFGYLILVRIRCFRKIISLNTAWFEGYWAEVINNNSKFDISLGEIRYNPVFDKYEYRGNAYRLPDGTQLPGDWESSIFLYDDQTSSFIFACKGSVSRKNEYLLSVNSYGQLTPVRRNSLLKQLTNYMRGEVVDFHKGDEASENFELALVRVKRRHFKRALGEFREPETDQEKISIIKQCLLDEKTKLSNEFDYIKNVLH